MNFFKNRPLAICCFAFLSVSFVSFYLPPFVKLLLSVVALIIGILYFKKRILVFAAALSVVTACLLGYLYFDIYAARACMISDRDDQCFEIYNVSFRNDNIAYLNVKTENGYKVHCTVYNPPEISVGDNIRGDVVYKEIEQSDDFNVERYYHSKNIWSEGVAENVRVVDHKDNWIRDTIDSIHVFCRNAFEKYTDKNTSEVLAALSIGDRSDLDASVERDFKRAGLSHMLAISGMHLSVIMGCVVMFTDLFSLNKRWCSLFIIVICICYILVAGASSSILRAGIMFIIMSLGSVFRRVSDPLTNLMLAVTLIVLFSPSSVFDTGLILSFTATLGIIVIVGCYMRRTKGERKGLIVNMIKYIFLSVLTTLSAYAFSFIPMLLLFDGFSVMSVLSNLLVSPLITVVIFCIPVFLALSRFSFIATCIGYVLDIITAFILWTVNIISSVPNAFINIKNPFVPYTYIAIAVGIALVFVFRKRNAYLLPFLCWFITFVIMFYGYNINLNGKCDVVMYSEASSDSIIMRNFNGCIYFDLGKGSASAEKRAFRVIENELYVNEIDYWIICNYTNDIIKSAYKQMNGFYVRNLCMPFPYDSVSKAVSKELEYYADKENVNVVYYEYSKMFTLNNTDITVYDPIRFDNSTVFIPSVDVACGERNISYFGCGYFDYCDTVNEYDILYLGECGTKRKQKESPIINCNEAYISVNNETVADNIENKRFMFSEDNNIVKIRISH